MRTQPNLKKKKSLLSACFSLKKNTLKKKINTLSLHALKKQNSASRRIFASQESADSSTILWYRFRATEEQPRPYTQL